MAIFHKTIEEESLIQVGQYAGISHLISVQASDISVLLLHATVVFTAYEYTAIDNVYSNLCRHLNSLLSLLSMSQIHTPNQCSD